MITYPPGKQYQLWVRDSGEFDGFAIYVNQTLVRQVGDQLTHKYPIVPPVPGGPSPLPIVIHFGGNDGGVSAIVDVTVPNDEQVIEKQLGLKHSYLVG